MRTADRGEREEGKGKSGRLSSQKQAEADERKRKAGGKPGREALIRKRRRREAPVEQLWEAKPGGTKGNRQEAKYQKPERKHGKPGGGAGGRRGSREAEPGTGEAAGEASPGRRERKNSGLSSQNRNRGGRKKPEGKGKGRRRKQKASTRGTAVGAKRGRAKGN